ncbi:phosphatase PAP2 family protein [Neorhizobium sp. BETTINA12A]|uniref:phosphatase PAP2 family protein n=1 Tax=Neorhizobium sp. BETTINA12A TaxID=2908924 RepID=UPI001FF3072F|nr:phosphatase PAP2 family protein [Neorhizobium sp. BETTINA12A]MCJ9753893.1 phosphatase PAP2 family protein [Neorhizobium sp. BETTINA12A]
MAFHQRVTRKVVERVMAFEPIGLMMVAFLAGGLFVFFRLTDEVLEGETHAFDEKILLALRDATDLATPLGPYWLNHAMGDITALGGVTVLTLMTVMGTVFLILSRQRAIALFMFLSIAGGWLLSSLLKLGVARPRPDIVPHLVEVSDLSFPSGHAMLSAVTYLTLGALLSRAQPYRSTRIFLIGAAIFLTFIIGFSRVYLGVHYPTDVLGGWCAGATWALACWMIARRYISAVPE